MRPIVFPSVRISENYVLQPSGSLAPTPERPVQPPVPEVTGCVEVTNSVVPSLQPSVDGEKKIKTSVPDPVPNSKTVVESLAPAPKNAVNLAALILQESKLELDIANIKLKKIPEEKLMKKFKVPTETWLKLNFVESDLLLRLEGVRKQIDKNRGKDEL